jgi:hypothetical protein
MKRFVAALFMLSGLMVAGGAKAANLGNFNANCSSGGQTTNAVSGNVGDTFIITSTSGFCTRLSGSPVVVSGSSGVNFGTPETYELVALGTAVVGYFGVGNPPVNGLALTVTVTAPAPQAVPTLSEWTQMLLGLLVITMIGWHFHRERSY